MRSILAVASGLLLAWLGMLPALAYENAYKMTAIDEVKVRILPPARLLETSADGDYFEHSSGLFRRLFDYIRSHDVAMTVPVEGSLHRAKMRFYLGSDVADDLPTSDGVTVVETSARQVVSIGGRGAYSRENILHAAGKLESWLASNSHWRVSGPPYAVFWNGPFTPWFMKRYEVHIPVAPVEQSISLIL